MEVWVPSTAGLDDEEKRKFSALPGLELRPLGRPALGHSVSRLHYPRLNGLKNILKVFKKEILGRD
jgi:hypothetical protein